jgi:A/G-specific adenine glycosylase
MLLAVREDGSVLLRQRPHTGIWGGLWCAPDFDSEEEAGRFAARTLGGIEPGLKVLAPIEHAFTHFDLTITPVLARCGPGGVMDATDALWYNARQPANVGLPAPMKLLLERLAGAAPPTGS